MATWITKLDAKGDGLRLAVKDAIDVQGVPTTAGCRAVADKAAPADADAACLAGARAAGARLVGKANLHELCFGTTGVNPWFGTPVNPLGARLVPGGSSSGSAVAVATGEADVGFGTDTGGSVRIPAACCGIVGLKTTWGRVSLDGVWPLSAALDTIGPLARDVAGVVDGMAMLEPGFSIDDVPPATSVGRFRAADTDPAIDAGIDAALAEAEIEVVDIELPGWAASWGPFLNIILSEAWLSDRALIEHARDRVDPTIADRVESGRDISDTKLAEARDVQRRWTDEVLAVLDRVQVIALPTLPTFPPPIEGETFLNICTSPFNLSGTPALSLPVPTSSPSGLPASLQLVARHGAEDLLCATGARVEAAVGVGPAGRT